MTPDDSTTSSSESTAGTESPHETVRRPRRRAASRPAGPPQPVAPVTLAPAASSAEPPHALSSSAGDPTPRTHSHPQVETEPQSSEPQPAKRTTGRRRRGAAVTDPFVSTQTLGSEPAGAVPPPVSSVAPIFQAPPFTVDGAEAASTDPSAGTGTGSGAGDSSGAGDRDRAENATESSGSAENAPESTGSPATPSTRRRRSRGGRNRRKSSDSNGGDNASTSSADSPADDPGAEDSPADDPRAEDSRTEDSRAGRTATADHTTSGGDTAAAADPASPAAPSDSDLDGDHKPAPSTSSRRRRRGRSGDSGESGEDSADGTVKTKTREPRSTGSQAITSVEGSTRIEAKKQRRREGREAGRRRVPILSESEFLARRESVDRVMAIRQRQDVTQIAVLEDDVLVEHYVALEEQSSLLGNVYLGRVQNVLPSMEAAFIDIGKGRNAVLYAGEVNWDLVGDRHQARRIENALKPGQQIMVQVSKDPVGHKGARLTSQISLPGRYLVYVPGGGSSGISRKLPDTERSRLKTLLKDILPDESSVIVRTAAEGASEDELRRDVKRLTERWDEIEKLAKAGKGPTLLYAEPDIMLKVVRDLFTEDFTKLVISGDGAWDTVQNYVGYVAPDLVERLERYDDSRDIFTTYRVEEQIAKALERKVWLPSGGSLVIDRTEAMTVVDVNTGKFTGSGGNLEQTVTKNNLEAAEEIVRQLRLRDIGGIIVIDFIDMVLENNRDLVLRRLVECLGRDRTRHQVAEVTSLGLVQMTRKRIGTGLVEAFSVPCETCHGRGVVIESQPVARRSEGEADSHSGGSGSSGKSSTSSSGSRERRSGRGSSDADAATSATRQGKAEDDPRSVERHSAAATATAAIAAALHLESKPSVPEMMPELKLEQEQASSHDGVDGTASAPQAQPPKTKTRKPPAKTSVAKTSVAKTSVAKKSAAKKSASKKSASKKSAAGDGATAPTSPAEEAAPAGDKAAKTAAKKAAPRKSTARTSPSRKTAPASTAPAVDGSDPAAAPV